MVEKTHYCSTAHHSMQILKHKSVAKKQNAIAFLELEIRAY